MSKLDEQCKELNLPLLDLDCVISSYTGSIEKTALNYFQNQGYEGVFDEGLNLFLIFSSIWNRESYARAKNFTKDSLIYEISEYFEKSLKDQNTAYQKWKNGEKIDIWQYKLPSIDFCTKLIDKLGVETLRQYSWNVNLPPVGNPDLTLLSGNDIVLYEVKSKYDFLTKYQEKYFPLLQQSFPLGIVRF